MPDGGQRVSQEFVPGPDTARAFRDALGRFATGVCVVTCRSAGRPLGITANSFASVSLDPPLVLWSPAKASRRYRPFVEAGHFAIHVMADHQSAVCLGFVREGAAFDALTWSENAEGVPLIDGCLARFDCVQEAVHDAGDHAIVIGRVRSASFEEGAPLLFVAGQYGRFTTAP
ncbi:flavin reductase [Rhodobacteraceae bacterium CCMM004]|nr:flavin reductase [Rhodobacteraceae bacterium CCMM004]